MAGISLSRWPLAMLVCTLCGCASTGLLRLTNSAPKASPKNPVVQVLALWQTADGLWDGHTTRGFSGQLYFLTSKSPLPAVVDGTVTVYVFDDQGPVENQDKPFHSFEFTPEMWETLKNKGKLGLSYRVFIPYTRKGYQQAQCGLIVRYTPREGMPVTSDMCNITLPGRKSKPADAAADAGLAGAAPAAKSSTAATADTAMQEALAELARKQRALDPDRSAGIPTGVDVPRRSQKAPATLSDAERERIIRDAQRQWREEDGAPEDRIGDFDERAGSSRSRTARRPAPRSRGVVHANYETVDDLDESALDSASDVEAGADDELPMRSRRPAARRAPPVDTSETDDPEDRWQEDDQLPVRQNRQNPPAGAGRGRALHSEARESHDGSSENGRNKMDVLTIALPGRG